MTNNIEWVPGRYYKTRDGQKVCCVGIMPDKLNYIYEQPVVILWENGQLETYRLNGRFLKETTSCVDIIAPYPDEPAKLEKIAYVDANNMIDPNCIGISFNEIIYIVNQLVERENGRK